jgi:hypothetical protein
MSARSDFSQTLALLQQAEPLPPLSLHQLSDLAKDEVAALEAMWEDLPDERRAALVEALHDITEDSFEVSFDAVFRMALDDESAHVRAAAIRGLWESEDSILMGQMLNFMQSDPDHLVRAAAASALGRFVYLGEVEEIAENVNTRLVESLVSIVRGSDHIEVRRRALEAVSYAFRPEVTALIREAYQAPELLWRISALFAMGRHGEAELWSAPVRAELTSPHPEMRFEAARAAGELEMQDTAGELSHMVRDEDPQVQSSAIWSLSQIGGEKARQTLTRLLESAKDEGEQEQIQEALENLYFTDELHNFSLLELGEGSEDGGGSAWDDDDDIFGDDENDDPLDEDLDDDLDF